MFQVKYVKFLDCVCDRIKEILISYNVNINKDCKK